MPDDNKEPAVAGAVVSALYLILGLAGNAMTLKALPRSQEVSGGARVYMVTVCLLDVWTLLVPVTRFWLLAAWAWDLRCAHPGLCKIVPWVEMTPLVASPLTLALLLAQVLWGGTKSRAPGTLITRCSALAATCGAVALSLAVNSAWIFLLSSSAAGPRRQHATTLQPPLLQDASLLSAAGDDDDDDNDNSSQAAGQPGCDDVPSSCCRAEAGQGLTKAVVEGVVPWLSAVASLLLPVLKVSAGLALLVYVLSCCRCGPGSRQQQQRPSAVAQTAVAAEEEEGKVFLSPRAGRCCGRSTPGTLRVLIRCTLWMAAAFLLTAAPLSVLVLADPARYWSTYETLFLRCDSGSRAASARPEGSRWQGAGVRSPGVADLTDPAGYAPSNAAAAHSADDFGHFGAFVALRLLFYSFPAFRWLIVCSVCGLWPLVLWKSCCMKGQPTSGP